MAQDKDERAKIKSAGRRRNPGTTFPRGLYSGPALSCLDDDEPVYCAVCGRPPRIGESLEQWRVRAVRDNAWGTFALRLVCPEHFQPGEPPLAE